MVEMDNEKLLNQVLNLHYRNRPKVVTDALQIIQNYCNKEQTDAEYDQVLQTLHDMMNDLPSNILLYFLTTVPLPKSKKNSVSTFSDLIKKSRATLLDTIKPILNKYIDSVIPPLVTINKTEEYKQNVEIINPTDVKSVEIEPKDVQRTTRTISRGTKASTTEGTIDCRSLLDTCVDYVLTNLTNLQNDYQNKNKIIWNFIKTDVKGSSLTICYKYIEDLNKKLLLLRVIAEGYVPLHVVEESYGQSKVFLIERNLVDMVNEDIFSIRGKLEDKIKELVYS